MKSILFTIWVGLLSMSTLTADGTNDFFERADVFFSKNVANGLVGYNNIDRAELGALADEIATYSLDGTSDNEALALSLIHI